MSALFNQTNIAPGTAFATGGGSSSNFPQGIIVGANNRGINTVGIPTNSNALGCINFSTMNADPWVGSLLYAGLPSTGYVSMDYQSIAATNSGSVDTFLVVDQPNVGTGANVFELRKISQYNSLYPLGCGSKVGTNFMEYGNATLDGTGSVTVSLLAGYSNTAYSVALTQTSSQPTISPWAKIIASNRFEIAGDVGATVSWMTIGQ